MYRAVNSKAYRTTRTAVTIANRFLDAGTNAADTAQRVRAIDTAGWQAIAAFAELDIDKDVRDATLALLHIEAEAEREALIEAEQAEATELAEYEAMANAAGFDC